MKKSETLTMLRVALVLAINSFSLLGQSRELSVTKTKLEEGKMQLGLALGALGETENPYKLGEDMSTTFIAPTADAANGLISGLAEGNPIMNVKRVREFLLDIINGLNPSLYGTLNPNVAMWMQEVMKSVTMARCWLGCELGRLRDAEVEIEVTQETLDLNPEVAEAGAEIGENIKVQAYPECGFMNWTQADHVLDDAQCVKLPEWEGFWFKSLKTGDIYVLTKDGEVLNTPQEEYKLREDWIVAVPTKEQYAILEEFFNGSPSLNSDNKDLKKGDFFYTDDKSQVEFKENPEGKFAVISEESNANPETGNYRMGVDPYDKDLSNSNPETIEDLYQKNTQAYFDETIGADLSKETGNAPIVDSVEEKSELSEAVNDKSSEVKTTKEDEAKAATSSKKKSSKPTSDNS